VTKSSDKISLDELRRANERPPPKREADLVPYNYAEAHPELFRRRRPSRRQLRRRLIRGG
jgi:hypothetical protein